MDRLNGQNAQTLSDLQRTEVELARSRERLNASLGALREEIADLTDWRAWIERRPVPFLAGAFALGLVVGWTTGRAR
jgi:hypothetical protein